MAHIVTTCLILVCFLGVSGCHWVGSTAGKAQAKIERKIDAVQGGYEDGYSKEKSKTSR